MAREKSEQKNREDPKAWFPLALKPAMGGNIAVHPDHPACLGWDYEPLPGPASLRQDYPVLAEVPEHMDWQGRTPMAIVGGELNPKSVQFLLVDGVQRVATAWRRGAPIEGRGVPLEDAEGLVPYLDHNTTRCESYRESWAVRVQPGVKTGSRDPYTLGARACALQRPGESNEDLRARMRASFNLLRKAKCLFQSWQRLGVTPEEAGINPRALEQVKMDLSRRILALYPPTPHGPSLFEETFTHAFPALIRGFVALAALTRENHAALAPQAPPPVFPRRDLLLAVKVMVDLIGIRDANQLLDFITYEDMGKKAAAHGVFARLQPSVVAAIKQNEILYASAKVLDGHPKSVQERALLLSADRNAWGGQAKNPATTLRRWVLRANTAKHTPVPEDQPTPSESLAASSSVTIKKKARSKVAPTTNSRT